MYVCIYTYNRARERYIHRSIDLHISGARVAVEGLDDLGPPRAAACSSHSLVYVSSLFLVDLCVLLLCMRFVCVVFMLIIVFSMC